MKIFIVNNYFPDQVLGGSEIQCWLIAKHLAEAGHKTSYLAVRGLTGEKQSKKQGVNVRYLASGGENRLTSFLNFYNLLKEQKPDICYIRVFQYFFVLAQICRFFRIPVVFNTSHINDCRPDLEKIKFSLNPFEFLKSIRFVIQRRLNFAALKQAHVITINKHHSKLLKEKYDIETTQIYNSMEDEYDEYERNKAEKKSQIVWVNNIKPRKRPESFIALANSLKNGGFKFLMIGNIQSDFDYYRNLLARTEKENPDFKYLGGMTVSKVNGILAESAIMVNTCETEGFGNNFIQAWLNECPTVTLEFDPDNIIQDNKIGFRSESSDKLKEHVRILMGDGNLRKAMGKKAREYALRSHSINNVKKYEQKFKQIVYEKSI